MAAQKTTIKALKPIAIYQEGFVPARIVTGDVVEIDAHVAKDLLLIGHAEYISGTDPRKEEK